MENRRNFIMGLSAVALLGGCQSTAGTGDAPPEGARSWNLPEKRRVGERYSARYYGNYNAITGVDSFQLLDTSTFHGRPAYRYRAELGRDGRANVQRYVFRDVETLNYMGATNLSGEAVGREYEPHRGILDFPLYVGKRYNVRYDFTNHGNGFTQRSFPTSVVVQAIETVTVPAGTFEALRLRRSGANFTSRIWYAPEIGFTFVKFEDGRNPNRARSELLEYRA